MHFLVSPKQNEVVNLIPLKVQPFIRDEGEREFIQKHLPPGPSYCQVAWVGFPSPQPFKNNHLGPEKGKICQTTKQSKTNQNKTDENKHKQNNQATNKPTKQTTKEHVIKTLPNLRTAKENKHGSSDYQTARTLQIK